MRRIAISGLVALTAMLGGLIPAVASATSSSPSAAGQATARQATAVAAVTAAKAKVAAARGAAAGTAAAGRAAIRSEEDRAAVRGADDPARAAASAPQLFVNSYGMRISCGSISACLSVGATMSDSGIYKPVAVAWNGKTWKSVGVKFPAGTISAALTGVSCKAATACLVTGEYLKQSVQVPYAASWNGSVLRPAAAPPLPKSSTLENLSAVSCLAPKDCVAVGSAESAADEALFTDTWNGSKWTEVTAADPSGFDTVDVGGLRCFSGTSCFAAGDGWSSPASQQALVATWNGKIWTAQHTATPTGAQLAEFNDISCVSPRSCAAVGDNTNSAYTVWWGFAEVWNGKAWTVTKWTGPKGDTVTFLNDVSCVSAADCLAVGAPGTSANEVAGSLFFNGAKWSVVKVPSVGPGQWSDLDGVSCLKASECVAAGDYGATGDSPLAGYWNGAAWKLGKA